MSAADILLLVGRLNLAAAAAIVVVLALRPLARPRLGARTTYALWLLPPVAMLASLIPARREVVELPAAPAETAVASAPIEALGAIPATPFEAAAPALDPFQLALAVWIGGAVLAAVCTLYVQWRFTREARRGVIGPAVVGVITPRVITPRDFATRFDAEEQSLVLAHEQVHIRRQDLRLNAVATAIQCLFWFNPFIHLAIRQMRIDQELACDEAVVTRFPEGRLAYARALVKSQLANRPLPLGCYWPSGTEHPFLERIAMLKSASIGRKRRLLGAAALGALCATCGVAAWAANPARVVYETESAPVVEVAAAPVVETPALQPPAPAPAQKAAQPQSAAEEVCLTNACAPAPAPVATQPVAETCTSPCRVTHIGAASIPGGRAFATYFDGNAPVLLKGRVKEVRMVDGMLSEILLDHQENGPPIPWRVFGPSVANLSPEARANLQALPGSDVVIRGYQTHDKTTEGGLKAEARDLTFADGTRFPPAGPAPRPPAAPTP